MYSLICPLQKVIQGAVTWKVWWVIKAIYQMAWGVWPRMRINTSERLLQDVKESSQPLFTSVQFEITRSYARTAIELGHKSPIKQTSFSWRSHKQSKFCSCCVKLKELSWLDLQCHERYSRTLMYRLLMSSRFMFTMNLNIWNVHRGNCYMAIKILCCLMQFFCIELY